MNPDLHPSVAYVIVDLRRHVDGLYRASRERSLALTKLDELELWLTRCELIPQEER